MRLFIFAVVSVIGAGAAAAQEAPLQKVYACAALQEADARLACYDAAVKGLQQAEASGGVAVVSREQIVEAEKQAFGLRQSPTLGDVARATSPAVAAAVPPPVEPDSVAAKITALNERADGRWQFTLENGQVWEQAERVKLKRTPKTGWGVEIKKAMMGSFLMSIENGDRGVRVRRVQ
jgi:hypothetical protein